MKAMRVWLAIGATGLLGVQAMAAPFVALKGGQRFEGISIRARADGGIILVTSQGPLEFSRDQIAQAVADRPADLPAAVQAVQAGKYDEAIPVLQRVVRENRWLGWDELAVIPLTQALVAKGKPADAVREFESVLQYRPDLEKNVDARWLYWGALAAAGRAATLEPKLDELIRTGPRPEAAKAQLLRGDLRFASKQYEAAVLDYLRIVKFFESERAIQPQAILKVAQTLEIMQDTRAKTWYKRVVDEFPSSPEAAEAKGKM